jgi:hypothetical protein
MTADFSLAMQLVILVMLIGNLWYDFTIHRTVKWLIKAYHTEIEALEARIETLERSRPWGIRK